MASDPFAASFGSSGASVFGSPRRIPEQRLPGASPETLRASTHIAELTIRDSRAKPPFLPPVAPAFTRIPTTPCLTAYGPDKVFDQPIRFPRGDVGAQMHSNTPFGRPASQYLQGNAWTGLNYDRRNTQEIGSSPRSPLRAFVSPRSKNIIMYQFDHRAAYRR